MVRFTHRRPRTRIAALAAVLAVSMPGAVHAQGPFTSLTFFGDSYADTGNLLQLTFGTQPPSPPYTPGRFSNGPIWVDYFAPRLGRAADATPAFVARTASGNYAVAAARTTSPGTPGTVPGTDLQIASYLTRPGATPGTLTDPTGLYAIFAGGSDIRDAGGLGTAAARNSAAAAAATNLVAQAGQLSLAGARSLLVFSFPSLGSIPEAQLVPGRAAILTEVTSVFNSTLSAGLAGLQLARPQTTFYNLRLDNLFANILIDARTGGEMYGLTNPSVPCLPPFAPPGAPSCDVSVFADGLHPTTRTHQLISDAAYTYVTTGQNVALVPEPATIVLVGGGLLLLGAVGARRRAA
jgi:outer membrane lipase/esterase